MENEYLEHHGRDGQQWGVRNGPPYPLNRQGRIALKKQARLKKKLEKANRHVEKETGFRNPMDMNDEELRNETSRLKLQNDYMSDVNSFLKNKQRYKELTAKGQTRTEKWMSENASKLLLNLSDNTFTHVIRPIVEKKLKEASK